MLGHQTDANQRILTVKTAGIGEFLVDALLTWRITSFLTFRSNQAPALTHVSESGPFKIFDKFRDAIGMVYDEYGAAWSFKQTNEIAKIFTCVFCASTWIGIAIALLRRKGIGYGLALSAATIMLEKEWWKH